MTEDIQFATVSNHSYLNHRYLKYTSCYKYVTMFPQ